MSYLSKKWEVENAELLYAMTMYIYEQPYQKHILSLLYEIHIPDKHFQFQCRTNECLRILWSKIAPEFQNNYNLVIHVYSFASLVIQTENCSRKSSRFVTKVSLPLDTLHCLNNNVHKLFYLKEQMHCILIHGTKL